MGRRRARGGAKGERVDPAAQESDSRHLGEVRPPRHRGERSFRRARSGPPAAAPRAVAGSHTPCGAAADRVSRGAGRPGARVRAADSDGFQADPGDSAAADAAGRGADAGRGDRPGGGGHQAVCHRREAGELCGDHPACPRERGKTRLGPSRPDVNRYLKWAYVEAANAICLTRGRTARRHVSRLYERVARRKGHAKAIGAVARHLAEATYWMLSKGEPIDNRPALGRFVHGGSARRLHERPDARPLIATSPEMTIMPLRRRRFGSDETGPRCRG
jgi:hypothetical protein